MMWRKRCRQRVSGGRVSEAGGFGVWPVSGIGKDENRKNEESRCDGRYHEDTIIPEQFHAPYPPFWLDCQ